MKVFCGFQERHWEHEKTTYEAEETVYMETAERRLYLED